MGKRIRRNILYDERFGGQMHEWEIEEDPKPEPDLIDYRDKAHWRFVNGPAILLDIVVIILIFVLAFLLV